MPPTFIERVPLPGLKNYIIFSVTLFVSALLFAWCYAEDYLLEVLNINQTFTEEQQADLYNSLNAAEYLDCLLLAILSQLWSIVAVVNMCYCLLIMVAKSVQIAVFGELRVSETQQLKERFWNYTFYRFIFIFGVLNVQYMFDAFIWTAWFSLLCGLQLLAQLSKFRFEYMSCSPTTPKSQHIKLIFLLVLVLLISFCLIAASFVTGFNTDWNTFGFMAADCLILTTRVAHVLVKYVIHLVDLNHDGVWEARCSLTYYTDLVCEGLELSIELVHNLHMVIWSNIFLSMASLVICMQVKFLFTELQKKYYKHRNYLEVLKSMEARFSEATTEDLEKFDDNCAICWDKMQKARKLPCGHLFHNSCLRSWMTQDVSCPTCRVSLSDKKPSSSTNEGNTADERTDNLDLVDGAAAARAFALNPPVGPRNYGAGGVMNRTNRMFRFDASRYVSWLPSFSVEVTHTQLNGRQQTARHPSQLDNMAHQVQNLFPSISLNSIIEDLRSTHSVEITIDNILEGRLILRPTSEMMHEPSTSASRSDDTNIDSHGFQSASSLNQELSAEATDSHSYRDQLPSEPSSAMTDNTSDNASSHLTHRQITRNSHLPDYYS